MTNYEFLKSIFDLAHRGIYVPLDNLPEDISREVVEKNVLTIELHNLIKSDGDKERIEELQEILYPKTEEIEE